MRARPRANGEIVISGNQIYRCRYSAVSVLGSLEGEPSEPVIRGIIISENIISECNLDNRAGTGSPRFAAIHARGLCEFVTIVANQCSLQYGDGISVGYIGERATAAAAVQIAHNICTFEGPDQPAGDEVVGIRLDGADRAWNLVR